MVAPVIVREGRRVERLSADFRSVRPIRVARSGGDPTAAIQFSELDEAIQSMQSALNGVRTNLEQTDQTLQADFEADLRTLDQRLTNAIDGVTRRATVATRVTSRAAAEAANVPGVTPSADANNPDSWILIDNATDFASNGIWSKRPDGSIVRATSYDTAAELHAGLLIYADDTNSFWRVPDEAAPVSATNDAIASVRLEPFGRAQDITATSFLRIVANELSANLNAEYFTVLGGALTLSAAFLQRIERIENDVDGLQTATTSLRDDLSTTQENLANTQTALSTVQGDITALQTTKQDATQVQNAITNNEQTNRRYIPLTNGVVTDDNGFVTTTFQASTGFGGLNFEIVSASNIKPPYSKHFSYEANKVAPDSYQVIFRGEQIDNNEVHIAVEKFFPNF